MLGAVVGYQAHWNTKQHTGEIKLRVWYATSQGYSPAIMEVTVNVASDEEMRLLIDLLRNESPIFYDTVAGIVRTGSWETVGEGEK